MKEVELYFKVEEGGRFVYFDKKAAMDMFGLSKSFLHRNMKNAFCLQPELSKALNLRTNKKFIEVGNLGTALIQLQNKLQLGDVVALFDALVKQLREKLGVEFDCHRKETGGAAINLVSEDQEEEESEMHESDEEEEEESSGEEEEVEEDTISISVADQVADRLEQRLWRLMQPEFRLRAQTDYLVSDEYKQLQKESVDNYLGAWVQQNEAKVKAEFRARWEQEEKRKLEAEWRKKKNLTIEWRTELQQMYNQSKQKIQEKEQESLKRIREHEDAAKQAALLLNLETTTTPPREEEVVVQVQEVVEPDYSALYDRVYKKRKVLGEGAARRE